MDDFTGWAIALASWLLMFLVRPTAGTDRALLVSNPSSPEGAIGSQEGNRAPGKGRFRWSHSPQFDKLRGLGDTDTLSQFQRALGCLGVSHLVAKDPQSKGKVERQFGFWQKRLPALFTVESASNR